MGFLSSTSAIKPEPTVLDKNPETPSPRPDDVYADLITRRPALLDEKLKLHERIIDEFNLTALEKMPADELAKQVRTYVGDHVRRESLSLNQKELDIFSNEIIAEMTGYGPLEPLLKDPTVTDILINTHKRCYIERFGQLQETKVHFKDEAHLLRIINRIVSAIGRRVDESSPMVDARLRDGSRVNVAVRPIAGQAVENFERDFPPAGPALPTPMARVATACPMRPRPTIPSVEPITRGPITRFHLPSRTGRSVSGNPRATPNNRASACSATEW